MPSMIRNSRSQNLDLCRQHVAGPAFGLDALRLTWIDRKLASQPENLDIDAAVEHFLVVQPAGGTQLLSPGLKSPLTNRKFKLTITGMDGSRAHR
jgi:hypothetical protein